jgi:hypothetical protein
MAATTRETFVSHPRRASGWLARRLAVLGVVAVSCLGLSAAANALPPGGGDPPPPPPVVPKPNLVVSDGAVSAYGRAQWEVRYTVSNRGTAPAPAFYVDTDQNGSAQLRSTAHASLAAGASRSETMYLPRSANCYLPARFTADSRNAVTESSESDNTRWVIGQTGPTCATLPRYQVKAVSFHANDESGTDWLGSDEPYWIFSGVGMPGTELTTASHVFGDIDTGDTASFGSVEGCLYVNCSGDTAPNGMGFSIQLWEEDLGYVNETLTQTAVAFRETGGVLDYYGGPASWLASALDKVAEALDWINSWAADDLIGSQTYAYAPQYLASRLPAIGGSFTETRTYSGGGGSYTMTVQVTRVG